MNFHRNLEFSARSANMKRTCLFLMCVLRSFLCFRFRLWLHMFEVVLYCIVVLSSVLCSSACFILQWFHPSARSLSHPRSLSILPSRFCVAPPGFNLSCLVLLLSISAASSRCFFALFPSSRFSVNPFFFHAALLYESPRRKPGWRFTAGSPSSLKLNILLNSCGISHNVFWSTFY